MKQIAVIALAGLLAFGPAQAQDEGSRDEMNEGLNLMEKGMLLMFRGIASEMEPALEDMTREMEPALRSLTEQMGPRMVELAKIIGELDQYHPPERLENGDIILRRKQPGQLRRGPKRGKPLFDSEGETEL